MKTAGVTYKHCVAVLYTGKVFINYRLENNGYILIMF